MKFELQAKFKPTGDQPRAIDKLSGNLKKGVKHQTLLGVTGSGKTFTVANVINQIQKPTLVIAHNKTLAAQLADEFREFFPNNAVHYFVSYYDYYQPEAYIPSTDTYIEKDSSINDEIDRLRHAATHALLTRSDVIIVASVSCIYSIGSPEFYKSENFVFKNGEKISRDEFSRHLINQRYERNDTELKRGNYSIKGDTLEIFPAYATNTIRVSFFGDKVEKISEVDWVTGTIVKDLTEYEVFSATHFVMPSDKTAAVVKNIRADLKKSIESFKSRGKLLEAQRIEERTNYDLEMIESVGYCKGVENYSRYFDGRAAGESANTLIDYFPKDLLMIIDESHMTVPQIGGMYAGDASRKDKLIEFGFRLDSARDNRPLKFDEFYQKINQVIFTSATPAQYEIDKSTKQNVINGMTKSYSAVVEQLVRPTGLVDPKIEVRKTKGQVDDLILEIEKTVKKGQRVLITTLTKRMAEELTDYLLEKKVKVQYLHSDVETLERSEILHSLRLGEYDVLVGINLLREGLDLPEVSLVAILDADKEGFLRSNVSLIQTIGRAARHVEGHVIMYADNITKSMKQAISETERRRTVQERFNKQNNITPQSISKDVKPKIKKQERDLLNIDRSFAKLPKMEKKKVVKDLNIAMRRAADNLEFEKAAEIRDEIMRLEENINR
jgi:excinuclease ABC subunit B